jgi:hypothetical protein
MGVEVHRGTPGGHSEKDTDGFSSYPNRDPKCICCAVCNSTWEQTGEECASS